MDWMKIGAAALLIMMFFFVLPKAMHMLKNSPKGSSQDWITAVAALGGVALFVFILIKLV